MRWSGRKVIYGGLGLLLVSLALGEERDDFVLAQQIQVAARNYQRMVQEFGALRDSVVAQNIEGPVTEHPKIQAFIRLSLNPSEMELRRLLQRYETEYGRPAYQKFLKREGLTDLLTTE